MTSQDPEFWRKLRTARDKLVRDYIGHPDVSLIDIGYEAQAGGVTQRIVLRIHVKWRWVSASPNARIAFPSEVDGIPVQIVPGEYSLEGREM